MEKLTTPEISERLENMQSLTLLPEMEFGWHLYEVNLGNGPIYFLTNSLLEAQLMALKLAGKTEEDGHAIFGDSGIRQCDVTIPDVLFPGHIYVDSRISLVKLEDDPTWVGHKA